MSRTYKARTGHCVPLQGSGPVVKTGVADTYDLLCVFWELNHACAVNPCACFPAQERILVFMNDRFDTIKIVIM